MPIVTVAVEVLAAVSALVSGALFLASTFVLRGLRSLPTADGIKAMNAINLATAKPIKIALAGAALLCLAMVLIWSFDRYWDRLEESGAVMGIAGVAAYGLGVILVTIERSVPLNRYLGTAGGASEEMIWRIYRRDWGMWNHVRTAACAVASVLLVAAVVLHTLHMVDQSRCMIMDELPTPIGP